MKSYYKFKLYAALFVLLDCFGPLFATTVYHEKKPSELSNSLYSYELSVKSTFGDMDVEIHAKETNEVYVKRVAQILIEDAPAIIEYFGYVPWNTVHFVVDGFVEDRISKRANGAAMIFPRPTIILYTVPPVGSEHLVTREDWVKTLVLHELVHILHMDQTAGIMKFFRYLMGSRGKLGGIVPGWFAEGVATWAEANFTNGGRLSRELFNFEYNNRILTEGFCESSVCLDNPGKPPYRGARYWYGSHFLKWVEDKYPGSMACIIKNNADNIPAFLHWAFRDCVDNDYQVMFDLYYQETLNNLKENVADFRREIKAKKFGHITLKEKEFIEFSNGMHFRSGKLFVSMIDDQKNDYLKVIDLNNKKQTDLRIKDVIEGILPSHLSDDLILKTYREFPYQNDTLWKKFSVKKEKIVDSIEWPNAQYVFELLDGRIIGLEFDKNIWSVWEKRDGNKELIFDLPPMANMFNPELIEGDGKSFISFRFHDYSQSPENEYLRVDLDNGKLEVLFQSDDSLELIGSCGKYRVLATKDEYYSLNVQNGFSSNLKDFLKEVVSIHGDDKNTIFLLKNDPKRIYFNRESCEEWIKSQGGIEVIRKMSSVANPNRNYLEDKSSYPELDHYLPHHWTVGFSSGDATSGWTFSTGVSDPGFVHQFSGEYKIYTDNDEKGGSGTYQYSNNYFDFALSYSKEYLTSNLKTTPDAVESTSSILQKDYYFGWLGFTPSLTFKKSQVNDVVSERKSDTYGLGMEFMTTNVHYDDFLRSASLYTGAAKTDTKSRTDYNSFRTKTRVKLHPSYRFDILLQSSYEKLDKTDFSSGVAYAGGASGANASIFHEFYGLQANDAFGNEIFSSKLELNFLVGEFYKGPKYFPLFIKKIHAIAGTGLLKAKFIFLDNERRYLRDEKIGNIYAGVSSDINFLYVASVRVDMIATQLINDQIQNKESQMLILIKAGL